MSFHPNIWTDGAVESAKKWNAVGISRSQIAVKIHEETGLTFSRNAVIGKLARLGEKCNAGPPSPKVARAPRPKRAPINGLSIIHSREAGRLSADGRDAARQIRSTQDKQRNDIKRDGAPTSLKIPFLDRVGGECAFICSEDGEPTTCCGHPQALIISNRCEKRSSYCRFHHTITHMGFGNYAIALQAEIAA